MNMNPFFSLAVVCLLGAPNLAAAESYQGVLTVQPYRARADVAIEARSAARNPISGEAAYGDSAALPVGQLSRERVRRAAVAAARSGNPYAEHVGSGVLILWSGRSMGERVPAMPRPTFSSTGDNES